MPTVLAHIEGDVTLTWEDAMPLWTPPQLGSVLRAQWDANALAGADASSVTPWVDLTSNAYSLEQSTGSKRPTLQTAEQNGLSVVRFDGGDALNIASDLGLSAQPFTCAAVWKPGGINQTLWQADGDEAFYVTTGPVLELYGEAALDLACTTGAYMVNVGVWNGASSAIYLNGNTSATGAVAGQGLTSAMHVGSAKGEASFFLNGDICEMLFINGSIGATDRAKVEGYLAWKWGLQANLPGGHAYAAAAPTVPGGVAVIGVL